MVLLSPSSNLHHLLCCSFLCVALRWPENSGMDLYLRLLSRELLPLAYRILSNQTQWLEGVLLRPRQLAGLVDVLVQHRVQHLKSILHRRGHVPDRCSTWWPSCSAWGPWKAHSDGFADGFDYHLNILQDLVFLVGQLQVCAAAVAHQEVLAGFEAFACLAGDVVGDGFHLYEDFRKW